MSLIRKDLFCPSYMKGFYVINMETQSILKE